MFVVEEAAGEAFPGHAPKGTSLCRLGSAIPGSAQSRKGLPGHSLRTVGYSPRLGLCDFQEKPSRPVPCT